MPKTNSYKRFYRKVLERLLVKISSFYGDLLVSVVVFGSVARDRFTPESDIDMLIVAENLPKGRYARIREFIDNIETPLEKEFEEEGIRFIPEISPVIKTPEEVRLGSPLFLDMTRESLILYDKDKFFKKYIDEFRKKLEKLGATRVQRGGGWYWVLKPDYKPGEEIEL